MYTTMKECQEQNGGWKSVYAICNKKHKKLYSSLCKEIREIVKIFRTTTTDIKIRKAICSLFFNCFKHEEEKKINRYNAMVLIICILKLNINKFELMVSLSRIAYNNLIALDDLFSWLVDYIDLRKLSPELSLIQKIDNYFKEYEFPPDFIGNYIAIKASRYDYLISLLYFKTKNPPEFQCPICNAIGTKPMRLAKHILQCKKNEKKHCLY